MQMYNNHNAPLLMIKNNGALSFSEFLALLYRHAADIDQCKPYFLLGMGDEAAFLSCLEYTEVYEEWLRLYRPAADDYKVASALVIPASIQTLLQTNKLQAALYARHTILEDKDQAYNWLSEMQKHPLLDGISINKVWRSLDENIPVAGNIDKQIL
jgi:hypothetical protein